MHEMSIANSILDLVLETLKDNQGTVVRAVQLRIGQLSGIVPHSLEFCFEVVAQGTPAEGAVLDMEMVPVTGQCLDCDRSFSVTDYVFRCPHCGGTGVATVTGQELQIVSIDME